MATFKQKQKEQQKKAIGIALLLVIIFVTAFYSYKQIFDQDSKYLIVERNKETNCPVNGPSGYTAIVIDQSEGFPKNQVQQIRSMFQAWLAGRTEDVLESRQDQDPLQFNKRAFDSDSMIQLYLMSEDALNTNDGLQPLISICRGPLPEEIDSAQGIFINKKLLDKKVNELVEMLDNELGKLLVEHKQKTSPIIETISALSATKFAKDMDKPHFLIMVSDMVQYGGKDNYSQFPQYGNYTLDYEEWKQNYKKNYGSLKDLEWQIIYLQRKDNPSFLNTQSLDHQLFWETYFKKSLYAGQGRFILR